MSHHVIHHALVPQSAVLALALGALVIGVAPPTWAQPAYGGRAPVAFAAMDTNRDGRVSVDEFAQHRARRMAARAAEGRPLRNAATAPTFESLDRDGNGGLSPDELVAGRAARFAARGDGQGGRGCRW
jgi:hypothetical protein